MARTIVFVLAGIFGVLVAMIGFAPATLADWGLREATAGRLGVAETDGTVWNGTGRLVLIDVSSRAPERRTIAGVAVPGRMAWNVRMLPLLLGIIDATVELDGMGEPVQLSGGIGEMRIAAGSLSLPSVDLGRLGSPWNTIRPAGALALKWDGITLRRGAFDGRASIELREMASALTPVRPLGSYRIGVVGEGNSAKLDISTISGPLLLEGDGTWDSRQGVRFSALASAEEREARTTANLAWTDWQAPGYKNTDQDRSLSLEHISNALLAVIRFWTTRRSAIWHSLLASVIMVATLVVPPPAIAQTGEPVALNFRDADIDTVIGAFGHLLDRTFIIDPRVRGKITVETPAPVSRADAFKLLLGALRLQGFTIVSSGRFGKVVPEADAKLQSGPVNAGRQPPEGGDQIVTQVFRLNYESATNLVPVLRPLIAPNNTISAYPNNNSLVITDYATNLQRIARIIGTLDSPTTRDVIVLPVRYGIASDMAVMLSRLLDDSQRAGQGAQVDAGQRVVVIADPNTNSIMLRAASPAKVNLAKQLLINLDRPSKNPGNIRVVYLRNANAAELAQTLQAVLSGSASGGASGLANRTNRATSALAANNRNGNRNGNNRAQAANRAQQTPVTVSGGGATIAADPTTNSLIITAPDAVYRNLRTVIDKLDTRRAQVYIESLIVEVSAEKAAEFGIQWQFLDVSNNKATAIGGTNFTNLDGGGSILQASQNIASAGGGINLGIVNGTTTLPGVDGTILNLPLLARALESNAGANIIATPNLLTMDNEEASIVIGQNVPFVTGQFSNTGATGGASVNPFQTIERKDVGTTLRVRPQVSESGVIKMEIFQEVSSVQASAIASDIITNRRAVETNVLVDNGQIIVLGGLIEERIEGGESKVPVLGDIPFLGALFRYDSRRRTKTNLLIFLRPTIVRDAQAAYGVTSSRYDYMRQLRGDEGLPGHWLLPDMKSTDMTPFPAPPPKTDPNAVIDREIPAAKPAFDLRNSHSVSPDLQKHIDKQRSGVEQPLHLKNEVRVNIPARPVGAAPPAAAPAPSSAPLESRVTPAATNARSTVPLPAPRQAVPPDVEVVLP